VRRLKKAGSLIWFSTQVHCCSHCTKYRAVRYAPATTSMCNISCSRVGWSALTSAKSRWTYAGSIMINFRRWTPRCWRWSGLPEFGSAGRRWLPARYFGAQAVGIGQIRFGRLRLRRLRFDVVAMSRISWPGCGFRSSAARWACQM